MTRVVLVMLLVFPVLAAGCSSEGTAPPGTPGTRPKVEKAAPEKGKPGAPAPAPQKD